MLLRIDHPNLDDLSREIETQNTDRATNYSVASLQTRDVT